MHIFSFYIGNQDEDIRMRDIFMQSLLLYVIIPAAQSNNSCCITRSLRGICAFKYKEDKNSTLCHSIFPYLPIYQSKS